MFQLFSTDELHNSQIKIFLFTFFFNNTFKIYAFFGFLWGSSTNTMNSSSI